MNETAILENPYFEDVVSNLKKGKQDFTRITKAGHRHFYVLDNNEMTDLALLANNSPQDFLALMRSLSKPAFIIPTIVIEESVSNIKSKQHFNSRYLNFYTMLATVGPILLMSTDDNFEVYAEGFNTKHEATAHYIELAQLSTDNIEIKKLCKKAKTVQDVDKAYRSIEDDAGERLAFLYIHALIAEKFTLTFLSNEIKGVYNKWQRFRQDKQLLRKIYVQDCEKYIDVFRVISYHKLIFDFSRGFFGLNSSARLLFIQQARKGAIIQRPVLYGSEADFEKGIAPVYEGVTNVKFNDFVEDNDIIMFY
ncbi:nitrogen regulatory protein PII-like uncharacterized protein [Lysinibacillus composti]|uniref:Uncharacterized protein n=1 Tax=Lysinibacillus composti TaxID=720633 RepID=A0A3N9UED3_9BACI|nr:hypothetical protein [Lysinibacillus composti]MBM7608624.1 nitrogen regulatory protein PII-like uncharacterized protein [Lysinibacillus composti]RQW74545.1 hypothetical protein EBB45_09915 [Lysinibacillus composti]